MSEKIQTTYDYRVIRKEHNGESYCEIHTVRYDKDGNIQFVSIDPISPQGTDEKTGGLRSLNQDIMRMLRATNRKEVLDADKLRDQLNEPNLFSKTRNNNTTQS